MYAKRVSFEDETKNYDDSSERLGPALLLDIFKPRSHLRKTPWSKQRVFDITVLLCSAFQATSTSVLYTRRCARQDTVLLGVDHRIGTMAIGSSIACIVCLILVATGWDWEDRLCAPGEPGLAPGPKVNDYFYGSLYQFGSDVDLRGTPNVTNKHLLDWDFALCIHLIHLGYFGRFFPSFQRISHDFDGRSAAAMFLTIVLPVLIILPLFLQFIMQNLFFRIWLRFRVTTGWKSKLTRILACLFMVYVTVLTIRSEILKVDEVVKIKATNA
ncbi:hypothetical protein DPSP01_010932 [Paraphaeosphaeria sporulosa]